MGMVWKERVSTTWTNSWISNADKEKIDVC